jgi:hypothetical protein
LKRDPLFSTGWYDRARSRHRVAQCVAQQCAAAGLFGAGAAVVGGGAVLVGLLLLVVEPAGDVVKDLNGLQVALVVAFDLGQGVGERALEAVGAEIAVGAGGQLVGMVW